MPRSNRKPDRYIGKPQVLSTGRIRCPYSWLDATGKRKTGYRYGSTERKAQAAARKALAGLDLNATDAVTVAAYASTWLKHSKAHVDYSTYRQRLGHLRDRIEPVIGPIPLADLKVRHAQEVLDRAADAGKAKGTVERIKSVMVTMFNAAIVDELVPSNVASHTRVPKHATPPAKPQVLTVEQARRIIEKTTEDPCHALYVLNVTTGARVGELCALDWEDIDLDQRTVRIDKSYGRTYEGHAIKPTKTASSVRTVVLTPQAVAALAAMRPAVLARGPVFTRPSGARFARHDADKAWKAMLKRLGLPEIRFHDGRHTAATLLLSSGVPGNAVQAMLGHASLKRTFDTYAHVMPGHEDITAAAMASILDDNKGEA